jgi:hypothetical protein
MITIWTFLPQDEKWLNLEEKSLWELKILEFHYLGCIIGYEAGDKDINIKLNKCQ